MRDEVIDIVAAIAMLAATVALSMAVIIPMYNNSRYLRYSEVYDKTAAEMKGDPLDYNEAVLGYSFSEAVIMLGGQTYFMPNPQIVYVGLAGYSIIPQEVIKNDPNAAGGETENTGTYLKYFVDNDTTSVQVRMSLTDWGKKFNNMYGGLEDAKNLRYDLRYDPVNVGNEHQGYKVFVVTKKFAGGEIEYCKCLQNGELEGFDSAKAYLVTEDNP